MVCPGVFWTTDAIALVCPYCETWGPERNESQTEPVAIEEVRG